MSTSNGEWDDDVPLKHHQRTRKLKRKRFPRDRDYVAKQLRKKEKNEGEKEREEEAKKEIKKQVKHFSEDKKQIKTYIRWIKDSLKERYPILDEGDVETKTAVASVKAGGQQRQKSKTSVRLTHLPTLIAVRNEEERSLEQNKLKAQENLYYLLIEHLKNWKTLVGESTQIDVEKILKEQIQ